MAKEIMNFVNVNGEVVDVYGERIIGEGESYERYEFMMKVKTDEDSIRDVRFSCNTKTVTGEESSKYKGFITIFDEIKTITENEKGDRISLRCKVVNNAYYLKGVLYEKPELVVDFANREKDGRKFEDNASFSVYAYIEDVVETEEGLLDFKCLVNEYKTTKSIRGHELVLKVLDKDLVEDFKSTYKKGDVAQLEGLIKDVKVKVEIPEEDLVELEVKGVGSAKQKIIEENARRKEMRENGVYRNEMVLELTGGYDTYTPEQCEELEYPFSNEDIDDMLDKIDELLDKSKDRDQKKNPGSYDSINDEDVPF